MLKNVQSSCIHNSPKWENPKSPTVRSYILTTEVYTAVGMNNLQLHTV